MWLQTTTQARNQRLRPLVWMTESETSTLSVDADFNDNDLSEDGFSDYDSSSESETITAEWMLTSGHSLS